MAGRLLSGLSLLLVTIAVFGSLTAQDVVSYFLDHSYLSAGRLIPLIIAGYLFMRSIASCNRHSCRRVASVFCGW